MADFDEVSRDFEARILAAFPAAALKGAEHLREVSVSRAPIETGNLRESAETRPYSGDDGVGAEVHFPGPYARAQEYELAWRHDHGGQALYLTSSVFSEKQRCLEIVAEHLNIATD